MGDRIVACYEDRCEVFVGGAWQHWAGTAHTRRYHTSAVTAGGLLLLGGTVEPTRAELVPLGGGQGVEVFTVARPGWKDHCSIQVGEDAMVVTGGQDTDALATLYSGLGGAEVVVEELKALSFPRHHHACGLVTTPGVVTCSINQTPGQPDNLSPGHPVNQPPANKPND